jgi:hypothetical protein
VGTSGPVNPGSSRCLKGRPTVTLVQICFFERGGGKAARLRFVPGKAPKVRRYTSPGQRTEPEAGPAAWVKFRIRVRAVSPIHPARIGQRDESGLQPLLMRPILPRPLDRPPARSVDLGWYNVAPSVLRFLDSRAFTSPASKSLPPDRGVPSATAQKSDVRAQTVP